MSELAAMSDAIRSSIQESVDVKIRLLAQTNPVMARIALAMVEALRSGCKVILFGNGGSAADAQHVAAELVNRLLLDRRALPALALTTDTSILTAMSNDLGFESVFARQIEALAAPGDVVVGLSTSGNSENVVQGLRAARECGAMTVGLTGSGGGRLKSVADICFCAPSNSTPCIQEVHITVLHAICAAVERELFGP